MQGKLKIRATVKLRNDHLIAARERLGMNQTDFAKHVGVPLNAIHELEQLNYKSSKLEGHALKVSAAIGIPVDELIPPGVHEQLPNKVVAVKEVPVERLLSAGQPQFVLPSPEDALLAAEQSELVREALARLSWKERTIIETLIGGGTLKQAASRLKITRECVRQVYQRALKKLGSPWGPISQYRETGRIDMTHLDKATTPGNSENARVRIIGLIDEVAVRSEEAKARGEQLVEDLKEIPSDPEYRRCELCDTVAFCRFVLFVWDYALSEPRWICRRCRRRYPYERYSYTAVTFGL